MRGEKIKNMEFNENKEVSFSSFLAGALLVNSNVNMLYLSKCIHDFNVKTNIDVNDYGNDFSGLATIVTMNNNSISLNMDYTAQLMFNDNKVTLYDYLYDFTTIDIRKYFDIPEKEIVTVYNPNNKTVKKKLNILSKIKRTKAYI